MRVAMLSLRNLLANNKLELGPDMVEAGLPKIVQQRIVQVKNLSTNILAPCALLLCMWQLHYCFPCFERMGRGGCMTRAGPGHEVELEYNSLWQLQQKEDEDLIGALEALDVSLKEKIQLLSSFEKYKKEVIGDSLEWTPMHTSQQVGCTAAVYTFC